VHLGLLALEMWSQFDRPYLNQILDLSVAQDLF
jgi:hypothetical protein